MKHKIPTASRECIMWWKSSFSQVEELNWLQVRSYYVNELQVSKHHENPGPFKPKGRNLPCRCCPSATIRPLQSSHYMTVQVVRPVLLFSFIYYIRLSTLIIPNWDRTRSAPDCQELSPTQSQRSAGFPRSKQCDSDLLQQQKQHQRKTRRQTVKSVACKILFGWIIQRMFNVSL